jgi:hypothetical protein
MWSSWSNKIWQGKPKGLRETYPSVHHKSLVAWPWIEHGPPRRLTARPTYIWEVISIPGNVSQWGYERSKQVARLMLQKQYGLAKFPIMFHRVSTIKDVFGEIKQYASFEDQLRKSDWRSDTVENTLPALSFSVALFCSISPEVCRKT